MNVNQMLPKHSEDNGSMTGLKLFLTADHELMFCGRCTKCLKEVSFLVPIRELLERCPVEDLVAEDNDFLRLMGILPDKPEHPPLLLNP